ncbi:MAG: hypothetical protein PHR90_05385 [Sphaerochaetaceae bacterium]|jgi:hypothetical protein|nr:hypothetical protein [Sphaerochaetaceae bacterium]
MVLYHAFNKGDAETFLISAELSEQAAIDMLLQVKGESADQWAYMGVVDIGVTIAVKPDITPRR